MPIAAALLLIKYYTPNEALSNILITSLSLFTALLFNLLLLSLDTIRKEKESPKSKDRVLLLMKETYYNIAYAILITLLTVSILLIPYLRKDGLSPGLQCTIWTIVYFLVANFILTMAMILKRMNVILTALLDESSK